MHNLTEEAWIAKKHSVEPWSVDSNEIPEQQIIQRLLTKKANATFGKNCYIAVDCNFFTDRAKLGNSVKIASLATLRGNIQLGNDVSVNPMTNIVGNVTIGNAVRIASSVQIFGFNHGFSRVDRFIKDQPISAEGIVIGDGCWLGAGAKILDGVKLGSNCIVAAGAVVTKSFDDFSIVGGNPARLLKSRLKQEDKKVSVDYLTKRSDQLDFCIDLPRTGYLDSSHRNLNGWIATSLPFEKIYMANKDIQTPISSIFSRNDVVAHLQNFRPKLIDEGTVYGFSISLLEEHSKLILELKNQQIEICELRLS